MNFIRRRPSHGDPEPCDRCATGLVYLVSFEDQRLCRNCVYAMAEERGWIDEAGEVSEHLEELDELFNPDPLAGWGEQTRRGRGRPRKGFEKKAEESQEASTEVEPEALF